MNFGLVRRIQPLKVKCKITIIYCQSQQQTITLIQRGETIMANVTGGCLCGRVRYTVTGEPALPHCTCGLVTGFCMALG